MSSNDPVEPDRSASPGSSPAGEPSRDFHVVGVGASAGALDSLRRLLGAAPADTPLAFVVVTHMSPDHESLLPDLLASHTPLEVRAALDGARLHPGTVHVMPPGTVLSVRDGRLRLEPRESGSGLHTPIDAFFRSLASEAEGRSVAVVLSGTGSDGARGVRHVKEAGGAVVVESPRSAAYASMPDHATEAVPPDLVLPAEEIVGGITDLVEHATAARARLEADGDGSEDRLLTLFDTLARQVGHDFTGYKRGTLVRRVQRRMAARKIQDPERYAELVASSEDEAQALFQDVLIGVTAFFRDPEAFRRLAEVGLPMLVRDGELSDPVRAWVPACSSGEEAYSIAMLLTEFLEERGADRPPKVFATDVDAEALARARAGSYPGSVADDLRGERVRRFFMESGSRLRVRPGIRSQVVFALHDLVRDAPFSRLDLISCRNLLIYLAPELQQRILRLFHHALRPGGILFLGGAESPGAQTDLFEPLDAGARIFRRREAVRAVVLPDQLRSWQPAPDPRRRAPAAPTRQPAHKTVEERARQRLLRRYGPPAVVVDDRLDVVFYSTRGLGLFDPPVGPPTGNLLKLLAEGLRPAVRAAIHGCRESGKEVRHRGVLMDQERRRPVDVMAEPLGSGGELEDLVLVSFEVDPQPEVRASAARRDGEEEAGEEPDGAPSWTMVQRLEEQLGLSREELNDTVERLETVNEELTGSNEELMSMNEELQASNEELEASKEELQAVNEELLAVNAELEEKVKELARANDDMTNLIVSSQAATVFLDRELRIQRMTPAAANTLDLDRIADRGRGAALLSDRLGGIDVEGAAAEVLDSLDTAKMDATTEGGQHFSVRLRPYRTAEDEIEGVALSLFDVTELEATRSRLASERAVLDAIFHATDVALAYLGPDLGVVSANGAFGEFCGESVQSLRDCLLDDLLPDADFSAQLRTALREDRSMQLTDRAMKPPGRDGVSFWDVGVAPVHAGDLRPSGLIVTMRETTDRVATLAELRESEERHRVMGEIIPYGVWLTDAEGRARYISPSFLEMTGLTLEEAQGLGWARSLHPDTRESSESAWRNSLEHGYPFEHEHRFVGADGGIRTVLAKGLPIRDDAGGVTGWAGINLDITSQKAAEEERAALAAEVERGRRLSALGVVSAGVAHEFNNLLAIFMGAADLLLEEAVDPGTVEECARTILATAGRGRSVVSQIMSVGRPPDPRLSSVSLPELVREVVEELRLSRSGPDSSSAELDVRADPPHAWVDRDHLAQVLHNLLDNARRSMEEADRGGGSIRVVVEEMAASELPAMLDAAREAPTRWVRVSVSDDGPGVPAEAEEKIFQPFFSTRPPGEGTGLGLPVARSLVLANGGWMGLGRGDGGAVFQVILPAIPSGDGAESPPEPGRSRSRGDGRLSGRRIVVVDDEQELVRLLCRALDRAGFVCDGYDQPGKALERLRRDPSSLDLLITDAKMPEVPGSRLVQELRGLRPELPVIVYSGQDELEAAELEALRVDRLLTKPVSLGGLVAAVRDLLAVDGD